MTEEKKKSRRGFASWDPSKLKATASAGGKAASALPTHYKFTPEDAREAGRRGGAKIMEKYGAKHLAELGKKGGIIASRLRAQKRAREAEAVPPCLS